MRFVLYCKSGKLCVCVCVSKKCKTFACFEAEDALKRMTTLCREMQIKNEICLAEKKDDIELLCLVQTIARE